MLVPPAWENDPELGELERAWCEYHAGIIELWDGPAAFVFSDGRIVGVALDRNGLRPLRYTITSDGLVVLASETGVVSFPADKIVEKGRLGPGQMFAVDVANGVLLHDSKIKQILAHRQSYQQWVEEHLIKFAAIPRSEAPTGDSVECRTTHFRMRTLSVNFATTDGPAAMEQALERLEYDALAAVTEGATLLVLSDRHATPVQAPIPMLIAVGAVHRALIRGGLRTGTSLICETGSAWDAH